MSGRIAFIDFEASSLGSDSYPIEVGWCLADTGEVESYLIRPLPEWSDWNAASEKVHQLSRDTLLGSGEPPIAVIQRMLQALGDREIYADGRLDQKWLARLFSSTGVSPVPELGYF